MLSVNLTLKKLSFELRFRMFIINGYYTKSKQLLSVINGYYTKSKHLSSMESLLFFILFHIAN